MQETKIAARLAKEIRAIYGPHSIFNIHGHTMQAPGWPDWFISTPVIAAWVETKGATTELKLSQKKVLAHLNACGQYAFVLRFLSTQIYMWEDYNGKSLQSCGGANWKDAAASIIRTLQQLGGARGAGADT